MNILPVSRVLSLQTRLFIQSEGRTADGGMRRIDSNEIGRSHTRIRARAPFSSASFECSALDLLPARTRSRTTLDNITKVRGSEAGGRFQFTHMLVPPWQNNQSEPPYQPLSIADLSRNLCQKRRRHLRGRLQTSGRRDRKEDLSSLQRVATCIRMVVNGNTKREWRRRDYLWTNYTTGNGCGDATGAN